LRLGWQTLVAPPARLYHRLQTKAEERYRERVAAWARSLLAPATAVPLDAIFVEPELLLPSPLPQSLSDARPAPGSPPALPLHQTLNGHPQLAILGGPGTGRTTLLAHVALACAQTVGDDGDAAEAQAALGPAQRRLPLYVLLPALDWNEVGSAGLQQANGIERLVQAAVAAVGGGGGMANPLRQRLQAGQAAVLADGWDELSPQQRQPAAAWLAELVRALPGNLWLVSAGPRGYAPLTEAGFVPLTLATWDARQAERLARRWAEANAARGEASQPAVLRNLVAELQQAVRAGTPPLELALRAALVVADGQAPAQRAACFERALELFLGQGRETWVPGVCRAVAGQLALRLQQEERTTASRAEIEAAIEAVLPPAEERPSRAAGHAWRALTGARGLMRPAGLDRYTFANPLWQAYLAARQLAGDEDATAILTEQLEDPQWAEVLRWWAELGDMGSLVAAWLRGPDDLFCTRLLTLSSWLRAAPEGAAWRDGAMAMLARSLLQPGRPPQVLQKLAEALAATGVPGVTYFFRQAVQHPDPGVRAAAVLGLTRTAREADLPALEAVMQAQDAAARETVVRGLAHLGSDAATRWLARIMLEGDETLSLLAAQALAQCGAEGVALLHEALTLEDVLVRRAAVYGLAQLQARDVLEKVIREEPQWIVRSAATVALGELEERANISGAASPPAIEQLPWLISWAAAQREGVGVGEAARRMLRRALQEGDPTVRQAAAQTLAQAGRPDDVEPLKAALAGADAGVAGAALEALEEIGRRYGLRIAE